MKQILIIICKIIKISLICGDLCWFAVICGDLWLICGDLRWFVVICGDLWWLYGPLLEGLPMEFGHHRGDTASSSVVSHYKSGWSTLNHLQFADVVCSVGVPNKTAILHDWSNESSITQGLGVAWALGDVPLKKCSGGISLLTYLSNVCVPTQLMMDSDPQVLSWLYFL